ARPPGLSELALHVGVSPRHLARRFAALTGVSPRAWADARRVARARELLTQGRLNVTAAAEALGFASIHAFSRWFHRRVGRSPSAFRERPSGF
ncbi:MAG: helix-turn-helix transcriptional regulator, partial [Planctomycetes bacterium]|nr:helix-turn-helix transcriptional regulator [Planctomycetota bacterium]